MYTIVHSKDFCTVHVFLAFLPFYVVWCEVCRADLQNLWICRQATLSCIIHKGRAEQQHGLQQHCTVRQQSMCCFKCKSSNYPSVSLEPLPKNLNIISTSHLHGIIIMKVQRLPVESPHQWYWGALCLYDKQHTSCSRPYTATFTCLHPPSRGMLCSLLG